MLLITIDTSSVDITSNGTLSPLSLLPMMLLPRLPTVMTKFSFRVSHTALLWYCVMVMLRFFSRAAVFLAFPPLLLLFALNLPCRLVAMAHALLGVVNSDLLLLLLTSQCTYAVPVEVHYRLVQRQDISHYH
jgi:hypothetical protein